MRKLLSISVFLLLSSTAAPAAELSLLAGYRTGGPSVELGAINCITTPCPQPSIKARDGEVFSLVVDLPFRDQLMFEILLSHQPGVLIERHLAFPAVYPPVSRPSRFDLTYLHLGLLREWRNTKVSPFAAVGIGVARLETNRPLFFFDPIDEDRLSASLAGGIKIEINKWLGVRVEGRGYWADMPVAAGDDLFQLELSSGLTFKL